MFMDGYIVYRQIDNSYRNRYKKDKQILNTRRLRQIESYVMFYLCFNQSTDLFQERQEEKNAKFKENQFNVMVSDMISVNRSLKVCDRFIHQKKRCQLEFNCSFHFNFSTILIKTLIMPFNPNIFFLIKNYLKHFYCY